MSTNKSNNFTDAERDELAEEPEMVINTTAPKSKGFNFKVIGTILMTLCLAVFLILQFNVLGKKDKSPEDIEKEKNAQIETATPLSMQGIDSVNRLPASYQNQNAVQPLINDPQKQAGPVNNQELIAAQQRATQQNQNGQPNPYNQNQPQYAPIQYNNGAQQPSLPAPSPEKQAEFDEKRRKQQLDETRAQQREGEERERLKQIEQERKQAFSSSIKFNMGSKSTSTGTTANHNQAPGTKSPTTGFQMPEIKMPDLGMGPVDQNKQKDKQTYLDAERNKPNYLKGNMIYPVSPYQIMAGAIIPASFITGLNSDLPGQIIGQVRENVYDTVKGRHLLIPQSTRIIGEYSSGVTFGQDRILIVWTRLIFPNGTSINLEGMPGVDLSGYAGSTDQVNHHFIKIASGVVLSSLMGAGVKIAAGNQDAGQANFSQLAASGAAQSAGAAADKILSKMIEQQSTLVIRPGTKFNVFVNKDIILRPFK